MIEISPDDLVEVLSSLLTVSLAKDETLYSFALEGKDEDEAV